MSDAPNTGCDNVRTQKMPNQLQLTPLIETDKNFPAWIRLLEQGYQATGFAGGVSRLPVQKIVKDMLSDLRAEEQIRALSHWRLLANQRVLEIGSGCGALVVRGRAVHGIDIYGVEPSLGEFSSNLQVCRAMLQHFNLPADVVQDATGEKLPFPDASFDIVHSSNVLEHVADPERTLAEAIRVLRPGGLLHIVVPNYGSWWEGHYGILWLPNLPRWLAKLYVRLLGRDPAYVDTLNLINHHDMKRWLQSHGSKMEPLDWGWSLFRRRVEQQAVPDFAALAIASNMIAVLHRLRLVSFGLSVAKCLHWETPIVLVAQKSSELQH